MYYNNAVHCIAVCTVVLLMYYNNSANDISSLSYGLLTVKSVVAATRSCHTILGPGTSLGPNPYTASGIIFEYLQVPNTCRNANVFGSGVACNRNSF